MAVLHILSIHRFAQAYVRPYAYDTFVYVYITTAHIKITITLFSVALNIVFDI